MASKVEEIFKDSMVVNKIKRKLPYLFQLAELESSRAGRVGMEVGSLRERIIVALLIYKFGEQNVETEIPITEPEADVKVCGVPISIKTLSSKNLSGVKLIWTVDAYKARQFMETYYPVCDMIFVHINWNGKGGFYYFPVEVQRDIFDDIGRERYIKIPKPGTNPRGVEMRKEALQQLVNHEGSRKIEINWQRTDIHYNPYERWIEHWKKD